MVNGLKQTTQVRADLKSISAIVVTNPISMHPITILTDNKANENIPMTIISTQSIGISFE